MESCAIDGNLTTAVVEAVGAAARRIADGEGPSFIEARTVRLGGHYNADVEHYRPAEDKEKAAALDPLLRAASGVDRGVRDQIDAEIEAELEAAVAHARSAGVSIPATTEPHVYGSVSQPRAATAEWKHQEMTYGAAVNAALRRILAGSPSSLLFGEDVAIPGGVFGVSRNLLREFGPDRVFDTPISESAILGAALGAAIGGLRPIVEVMWADFLLVALDQLVNQAANVRYISRGTQSAPFVVRTQQGTMPGSCAQHSQSLEAILAHIPGLRVGMPSTPQDAYEMTIAAFDCDDPVVLIESRALYQKKGVVELDGAAGPVGGARLRRSGSDAVVITWGAMVDSCLVAAERLEAEGLRVSVLDLRWLSPLDVDSIASAVKATNRVLVAHEANRTGGFGGEIVARVNEESWDYLDAPPARLAAPDTRMPAAPSLQAGLVPDADAVVLGVPGPL